MSTSIEPYRPAGLPPRPVGSQPRPVGSSRPPVGSPAIIDLYGANVACTLRITEPGSRAEHRTCAVLLANKAQVAVTGRLYGIDRRKRTHDFGQIAVMPNGLGSSSFTLPAIADRCEHVYLEVSGDGIKLSADARIRTPVRNSARRMIVTGAVILAVGSATAATAFLVERPSLAQGTAPAGSLSAQSASAAVPPIPAPVLHAALPHIGYFSAHRERYAGKTSVLASYLASGTSGTLRVLDEQGRVLGSSPFSHVGTSRVALKSDPGPQDLRAEIEVAGAGSRTTAAVEIPPDAASSSAALVTGNAAAAAAAARAVTASTFDDGGSTSTPNDPFFVDQRVVGGQEFRIEIRHPLPNLRIGLQTTTGTTLDEVSVPPDARAVTLRAPASSMVEIYYLAGTFTNSSAEETVIRSLRIYPD